MGLVPNRRMRGWVVASIVVLGAAGGAPGDDAKPIERPIPQDPAKLERTRAARRDHYRRVLGDAYEKVGKHDPRWDDQARRALDHAAQYYARPGDSAEEADAVHRWFREALDAGCDDPLVRSIEVRLRPSPEGGDVAERLNGHVEAATALEASRYPPMQVGLSAALAGEMIAANPPAEPDPDRIPRARRWLRVSLDQLVKSATDDPRTPPMEREWFRWAYLVERGLRACGDAPEEAARQVDRACERAPALAATRHKRLGDAAIDAAWEARGDGPADGVPAGGWTTMRTKLLEARREFEAAAAAQPDDPYPPARLIVVDMGLDGDRAAMEALFRRAMEADGDDRDACVFKLTWLEPKWHGTTEDMEDFARALEATGNWQAGLTLIAADAHLRIARTMEPADGARYLSSEPVYRAIAAVYDAYLAHRPDDRIERTNFAVLLTSCARSRRAVAQFQKARDIGIATPLFTRRDIEGAWAYAIERAQPARAPK